MSARLAWSLALLRFAAAIDQASAQAWPNRAVTMGVPYGPGASNDLFTRALAAQLSFSDAIKGELISLHAMIKAANLKFE